MMAHHSEPVLYGGFGSHLQGQVSLRVVKVKYVWKYSQSMVEVVTLEACRTLALLHMQIILHVTLQYLYVYLDLIL